jgi:hypothetical protein
MVIFAHPITGEAATNTGRYKKVPQMSVERYNKTWYHFSGSFTNYWWDVRRFGVNPAGMWPYQAEP